MDIREKDLMRQIELFIQKLQAKESEIELLKKTQEHNETIMQIQIKDLQDQLKNQMETNKKLIQHIEIQEKDLVLENNSLANIAKEKESLQSEVHTIKERYKNQVEMLQNVNAELQELKQNVKNSFQHKLRNSQALLTNAKKEAKKEQKMKELVTQDMQGLERQLNSWQYYFKSPLQAFTKIQKLRSKVKFLRESINKYKEAANDNDMQVKNITQQKLKAKKKFVQMLDYVND